MQDRSKPRRRHSAQFKAEVLQACAQPGASTAGVALAFGLNANLVRQWRRGLQRSGLAPAAESTTAVPRFIPLQLEEARAPAPLASEGETEVRSCAGGSIELQLQRGPLAVSVRWPADQAAEFGFKTFNSTTSSLGEVSSRPVQRGPAAPAYDPLPINSGGGV